MQAHVLATAHPHAQLQAFQAIPAMHALLVHLPALTPEHDVNPQVTESRPGVGNLADALSQ